MKVLSLFDGISCGRVALEKADIEVSVYHAYEIDKDAIKVSQDNYPDIVHFGDVFSCSGLDYDKENFDLLIGGSPCQDVSKAKINGKGLQGSKSSLFFEYLRIKEEMNPKYFLYENVESMKIVDREAITDYLGIEPIVIDSSLVSGQRRKRLYWTNIPNVTQPEDKEILYSSILEDLDFREIPKFVYGNFGDKQRIDGLNWIKNKKSNTLTTNNSHTNQYLLNHDKSKVRLMSQLEWERLQTLPDGYTRALPKTKACHGIGNGWTVDVVAHIFKGLK